MRTQTITILTILTAFTIIYSFKPSSKNDCKCDKDVAAKTIKHKDFNRLSKFDDTLTVKNFYTLSAADNRILWYRDVESPKKTKFTSLWNDYVSNNYHASHLDFINYYQNKKDIELAFQFGPAGPMWTYHIFVIKKVGCCYLATRSTFTHARFTGKRYAILDTQHLDSLYSILSTQNVSKVDTIEARGYSGYFIDNRNNKSYYIVLKNVQQEIKILFDYVDKKIKWSKTYSL